MLLKGLIIKVNVFVALPNYALLNSGVNAPIRNTENGRVRGILSAEGQSYLAIPYGKAERFVLFFF